MTEQLHYGAHRHPLSKQQTRCAVSEIVGADVG